jgi:hypothetical protein
MIDPSAMPDFREVFDELKSGRHLCAASETARLWLSYRAAADQWRELFGAMGYELHEEHETYCYVAGDSQAKGIPAIALFVLVLIRANEGADRDMVDQLTMPIYSLASLPHLADDRHRQVMALAGITSRSDIEGVVKSMRRLGFANGESSSFRLTLAVRRIVDLCLGFANFAGDADAVGDTLRPTDGEDEE